MIIKMQVVVKTNDGEANEFEASRLDLAIRQEGFCIGQDKFAWSDMKEILTQTHGTIARAEYGMGHAKEHILCH